MIVFLSAETGQFADFRNAVAARLQDSASRIRCQGDLRNLTSCSLGNIVKEVDRADRVFCVVGDRSGSFVSRDQASDLASLVPAFAHFFDDYRRHLEKRGLWAETDGRVPVSYTQCELLLARATQKHVAFLFAGQTPVEAGGPDVYQLAFRDWLASQRIYSYDSERLPGTDSELSEQIARAWDRVLAECERKDGWAARKRQLLLDADELARGAPANLTARDALRNELLASAQTRPATLLIAGASFGKSSLMQIIGRARADRVAARYRFDLDRPEDQIATHFVESLAAQMADWAIAHTPGFLGIDQPRNDLTNALESSERNPREILQRLLTLLRAKNVFGEGHRRYLILVDALDEAIPAGRDASPEQAEEVLQLLSCDEFALPPWLAVIATAQPSVLASRYGERFASRWNVIDKSSGNPAERNELDAALFRTSRNRLDEFESAHAFGDGQPLDDLAKALVQKVDGNFLYLDYVLNDAKSAAAHGKRVSLAWIARQPGDLRDYYAKHFDKWYSSSEDQTAIRRVLSVMMAVRKPQTPAALAALSEQNLERTLDLLERMAAFLEPLPGQTRSPDVAGARTLVRADCPAELHHSSTLRAWLCSPRAGAFRITDGDGHAILARRVIAVLKDLPRRRRDVKLDGYLHDFFIAHGLHHVLTAAMIAQKDQDAADWCAAAVPIAAALNEQSAWPDVHPVVGMLGHYNGVLFDLLERLRVTTTTCGVLRHLDTSSVNSLVTLVVRGCTEIPRLYPPLRILADYHLDALETHAIPIIEAKQLLTRYVMARALADSFHMAGNDSDAHCRRIAELAIRWFERGVASPKDLDNAAAEPNTDLQETGCYALKFLYANGSRVACDNLEAYLAEYVSRCARSADYNPRMALGEMLIELAIAGRRRGQLESLDACVPHAEFWQPCWPYHEIDLCEMFGALAASGVRPLVGSKPDGAPLGPSDSFVTATRHATRIEAVASRLQWVKAELCALEADLPGEMGAARTPRSAPPGGLPDWSVVEECLQWKNYRQTEKIQRLLLRAGKRLAAACLDAEFVKRFLYAFVLHPTWEITETAASVAAELREVCKPEVDSILQEWSCDISCWQPRYAAIDAAYNSRHLDQDALFHSLVMRHYGGGPPGREERCERVQFLCAEEVFLAVDECIGRLAEDDDPTDGETPLGIFQTYETPIRWWLEHAADCALLDEVFRFVQRVLVPAAEEKLLLSDCREPLEALLASLPGVSEYLTCGREGKWWERDRDSWLAEMDRVRRRIRFPDAQPVPPPHIVAPVAPTAPPRSVNPRPRHRADA